VFVGVRWDTGEFVLIGHVLGSKNADTNETQTVVVGKAHATLGQEPIAILESFNGKSAEDLAGRVLEMFGPDWQLGGVIEMKALGIQSFPLNATGKIQKLELAPLIDGYMKSK
jgi:hypothetical protein